MIRTLALALERPRHRAPLGRGRRSFHRRGRSAAAQHTWRGRSRPRRARCGWLGLSGLVGRVCPPRKGNRASVGLRTRASSADPDLLAWAVWVWDHPVRPLMPDNKANQFAPYSPEYFHSTNYAGGGIADAGVWGRRSVGVSGCFIDPAARQPPDHLAGLSLLELPAGCRLGPVMASAEWRQVYITTHLDRTPEHREVGAALTGAGTLRAALQRRARGGRKPPVLCR